MLFLHCFVFSYNKLVVLMTQGMLSVRKHVARILTLVQVHPATSPLIFPTTSHSPHVAQRTYDIVGSGYPCFKLGQRAVDELHARCGCARAHQRADAVLLQN